MIGKEKMGNMGKALWKKRKYYPVVFTFPVNSCNGEISIVLFEDNDWAILHKNEILSCPVPNQHFDVVNIQTCWASPKAREVINRTPSFPSLTPKNATDITTLSILSSELLNLSKLIIDILNSDAFDPSGKNTNKPLFERPEKWITNKLALLLSLKQNPNIHCVVSEERYVNNNAKCDMVVFDVSGKELWIEGKLSWEKKCTDWRDDDIEEYFKDIKKLNNIPNNALGIFMLLAFRQTESKPDDSLVNKITERVGTQPHWDKFSMPTKDHGPCFCHLLLWHVK